MNILFNLTICSVFLGHVFLAADPCSKKRFNQTYEQFLDVNLNDMSVHSIKNIGDTTPACKHLKDRHITIIKQKLGDSAYLKLNTRCIVFMVRENPTLFDTLMDGCTEEDQKLFFKRKDKYFCDKKEAFKDTNIFQDLKKFCKSHKQQKQISNLKSEIEAMKREKEARQAPLKGRKNTATAGPDASKASVIAVLAILTLFY